jgi:hypothetical protein
MPTRKPTSGPGLGMRAAPSSLSSSCVARVEPAGKQGEFEASKLKRAGAPRKGALYQALLAIGRKEKSISPLVLRKYDVLLRSKEVRRRAQFPTDPASLAEAASEALKTIVDGIGEPIPRLIAQAALCTEPQYIGLRITQREDKLAELPDQISKEMFKYHRHKVLVSIVDILESEPVAVKGSLSTSHPLTYRNSSYPVVHTPCGWQKWQPSYTTQC